TLADDHYAMPLAVMGRSLLENHRPERALHLKIIDGGVSAVCRQRVERSWKDAAAGPVSWEWVQPQFGNARSLPSWGRVPALTFARLFLDAYFAECDGRAILLDSDTLILTDLTALHDVELDGNVVGACVDPFIPSVGAVGGLPASARPGSQAVAPYFNAGVLVADLGRWRAEQVAARSLEYIGREFYRLRQYDQDALNAVLADNWKRIDARWNTQPRTPNALGLPLPDNPCIVHFSGRLKPWAYDGATELDMAYFSYLERTDWRGLRPPATWQGRMWKLYDSPVRRLLHGVECRVLALQHRILGRMKSRTG
ncbi:MAG: glycosyltransferase family 8 protein, partial [Acidobacteria bacterium]|nr:glycosyltransferase family 8 protein [Acidobacteriota bacterium]